MNRAGLLRSALVALTRNKLRSLLTVLRVTIGITAVICVIATGKAGQTRVEQQLNNRGDNLVWIEANGRAVNAVRTGMRDTKTPVMADAITIKSQVPSSKASRRTSMIRCKSSTAIKTGTRPTGAFPRRISISSAGTWTMGAFFSRDDAD